MKQKYWAATEKAAPKDGSCFNFLQVFIPTPIKTGITQPK